MEINALTLAVTKMATSLLFYHDALGLDIEYGGDDSPFTTLRFGTNFINLFTHDHPIAFWGRAVLHVDDPDAIWQQLSDAGYPPEFAPTDASWGERYFHVRDPDGHQLSFAKRL